MSSKEINGFKVVPINLAKESNTSHQLFLKEHSLKHQEEDKPAGRTLFVLNIPPYIENEHLKALFSPNGKVNNIILQPYPTNGFKQAYVVFSKREGLLKALKVKNLKINDLSIKTGLDKWLENYKNKILDPEKLAKEINSFMLNFDKTEEINKNAATEVDDEGWTVVSRKSNKPGIANKESVKLKLNEKIEKSSKKKELKNFYTFQIKEGKMRNLTMLRKNYEEAKQKVHLMKSSRRFKPY